MKNLKEALWSDYTENTELINGVEIGTTEYKNFMDERDKIRNELIKVEQIEEDRITKEYEIDSEKRNNFIGHAITLGTFAVSTIISVYAISKTFRFDQEATITSTLGRGIINNVTSKIFKR